MMAKTTEQMSIQLPSKYASQEPSTYAPREENNLDSQEKSAVPPLLSPEDTD